MQIDVPNVQMNESGSMHDTQCTKQTWRRRAIGLRLVSAGSFPMTTNEPPQPRALRDSAHDRTYGRSLSGSAAAARRNARGFHFIFVHLVGNFSICRRPMNPVPASRPGRRGGRGVFEHPCLLNITVVVPCVIREKLV